MAVHLSDQYQRVVLQEAFGGPVLAVTDVLRKHGASSISTIAAKSSPTLKEYEVKSHIATLKHHGVVALAPRELPQVPDHDSPFVDSKFMSPGEQNTPLYELKPKRIDQLSLVSAYGAHVDGEIPDKGASVVVNELQKHGRASPQQLFALYKDYIARALAKQGAGRRVVQSLSPLERRMCSNFGRYAAQECDTHVLSTFKELMKELLSRSYITDLNPDVSERPAKRRRGVETSLPKDFMSSMTCEINHDQFTIDFRRDQICAYVEERFDALSAQIVRVMLNSYAAKDTLREIDRAPHIPAKAVRGRAAKKGVTPDDVRAAREAKEAWDGAHPSRSSPPAVNADTIAAGLLRLPLGGVRPGKGTVLAKLHAMTEDNVPSVLRAPTAETNCFYVNIKGVVTEMKALQTQAVLKTRFSLMHARIWKLLTIKLQLEEAHIPQMALVPGKEARKCLYELFQNRFVHLQEVPKGTGGDRSGNKLFYLWSAPLEPVFEQMLYHAFYKGFINLTEQKKVIAEKLAEKNKATTSEAALTDEDKRRLRRAAERVNTARENLSQQIALFRDF